MRINLVENIFSIFIEQHVLLLNDSMANSNCFKERQNNLNYNTFIKFENKVKTDKKRGVLFILYEHAKVST